MLRGIAAIDSDRAQARTKLAAGLAATRGAAAFNVLVNAPHVLAQICAQALDMEIEPEYVRTVISRRKLVVPFAHARAWP